jgi:hypothetical protein
LWKLWLLSFRGEDFLEIDQPQKWLMSIYSCSPINHVHDHVAEKLLIQKYHSLKVKTVNEKINQFVFIIADFYIGGVINKPFAHSKNYMFLCLSYMTISLTTGKMVPGAAKEMEKDNKSEYNFLTI